MILSIRNVAGLRWLAGAQVAIGIGAVDVKGGHDGLAVRSCIHGGWGI